MGWGRRTIPEWRLAILNAFQPQAVIVTVAALKRGGELERFWSYFSLKETNLNANFISE